MNCHLLTNLWLHYAAIVVVVVVVVVCLFVCLFIYLMFVASSSIARHL